MRMLCLCDMTKASAEIKIDHATMVRKTRRVLSQRQINVIVYLLRLKMIAKADNVNGGRKNRLKNQNLFLENGWRL